MSEERQPLTKVEAIALLKNTINQLETIVNQLDAEASEEILSSDALLNLSANTEELATSLEKTETVILIPEPVSETVVVKPESPSEEVTPPTPEPEEDFFEEEVEQMPALEDLVVPPPQTRITDRLLPSFATVQNGWDTVLNKVRSFLPTGLSEKLSDWAITGILAGLIVTILLTGVILFPQKSTEVAEVPPPIETPPEIQAPKSPQPVKDIPLPEPKLTPEQSLIAAIQNQVAEITNQYAEGLIESIEANFVGSRLMITVSDQWYSLTTSRQDKLANEMFSRSQELDFSQLEIIDTQGTLLARTPVVGNRMVVLKRQQDSL